MSNASTAASKKQDERDTVPDVSPVLPVIGNVPALSILMPINAAFPATKNKILPPSKERHYAPPVPLKNDG